MIIMIIKQNIIIINVETKQTIPKAGEVIKNTTVNTVQNMQIPFIKDKASIIRNTKINPKKYIIQIIKHIKKAKIIIKIIKMAKYIIRARAYTIKAKIATQNPMLIVEHIQIAFGGHVQVKQMLKQKYNVKINSTGIITTGEKIKLIVKQIKLLIIQIDINKQAIQIIKQVKLISIGKVSINIIIKIIIIIQLVIRSI